MAHYAQKLSFAEKAGYSLGDASANFVFQLLLNFQAAYYIQTLGLDPAVFSWVFLLGRIFDAVTDPVMGFIADRTQTRWGKFRPWVLWSALPFSLVFWLSFTAFPSLSGGGLLVYMAVMYFLLMLVYTVNNIPYATLNGVMTGDVNERTSLSQYRFVAAMAASLLVQSFTLPLVDKLGGGDARLGWSLTVAIFALLSSVFFVITFFASRERVEPDPSQEVNYRRDFAQLFANRPWVTLFLATLCIFVTLSFRGGAAYFYNLHYLDSQALHDFLSGFGLTRTGPGETLTGGRRVLDFLGLIVQADGSNLRSVFIALLNFSGTLVTLALVFTSKPLSIRFGKKTVFIACMVLTTIFQALQFLPLPGQVTLLYPLNLLTAAAYAPTIPLLWAMIADAADFGEWKFHRRATGLAFAGVVFALKFGLGVGGFIQSQVLAAIGYVNDAAQSLETLHGMRLSASLLSALPFALSIVFLCFYPITREMNLAIGDELAARRRQRETPLRPPPSPVPPAAPARPEPAPFSRPSSPPWSSPPPSLSLPPTPTSSTNGWATPRPPSTPKSKPPGNSSSLAKTPPSASTTPSATTSATSSTPATKTSAPKASPTA